MIDTNSLIKNSARYYIYGNPVDMRKGVHSLYNIIKQQSNQNRAALNGDLFVFIGSNRKNIKIIWWQTEGFAMFYKKLEIGCFKLPNKIASESFRELKQEEVIPIITSVKHRSIGSIFKREAALNI